LLLFAGLLSSSSSFSTAFFFLSEPPALVVVGVAASLPLVLRGGGAPLEEGVGACDGVFAAEESAGVSCD